MFVSGRGRSHRLVGALVVKTSPLSDHLKLQIIRLLAANTRSAFSSRDEKRADPGKRIVGITVGIDGFSNIKCG